MPDFILNVFYLILLGQLFILSYYYPKKFYTRMLYVVETYPPSRYPKLYPKFSDKYLPAYADVMAKKGPRLYKTVNLIILLTGLGILGFGLLSGYRPEGNDEDMFVAFFGMLQMSPVVALELLSFKQFKVMRENHSKTRRTADLHPRRLFDFISPWIFGLAAFMVAVCVVFELWINDFVLTPDDNGFVMLSILFGVHVYFAVMVAWQMYGKKHDPYQASKDRLRGMEVAVKSAVYVSMSISVFFLSLAVVKEYNLDYLDPLLMSVYFQGLAVFGLGTIFRTFQIEDIDFDVYKDDQPAT